jgi:S1-C subfamily serine protease
MAYMDGAGVVQDYTEAALWIRLAAEQGDAEGQVIFGLMHKGGDGVSQDFLLAYMWINLGIAGLPPGELRDTAVESRGHAAAALTPAQFARAQEMARNWRPASRPMPQAASPPQLLSDEEVFGRSAALEGVQADLAELGYDPGPVDGVLGRRTRAAIRAFQADVGLPVDGRTSDELIAALTDAVTSGRSVAARSAPAGGALPRLDGTGTGFAVGRRGFFDEVSVPVMPQDGQIVTNHHVVADCPEVRIRPPGQEAVAGAIVARDSGNDLALLRAPVRLPVAVIRDDPGIRAGDSVVAVGFPLHGLLASEANVTTGTVSALAGIGNDTRFLQMTVPVQPGNSGGPLLDLEGRVVGVVVGKLDALKVASVTGDIPQNVNFAIKAGVVRSFLDASGVAPSVGGARRVGPTAETAYPIPQSPATVGADAKAFTVLVECWK